jgi:hypothetical protein
MAYPSLRILHLLALHHKFDETLAQKVIIVDLIYAQRQLAIPVPTSESHLQPKQLLQSFEYS